MTKQFPFPWRGIGVLVIFLLLAPPVYVAVAAFMGHYWLGGRRLLFEIGAVLSERVLPALMIGYSLYMPPVFFAALWAAWRAAHGAGLSLSGAIGRMIVCGFGCEVLYQAFVLAAGGPLRADVLMVGLVQWILSAFICWCVCAKFGLTKFSVK